MPPSIVIEGSRPSFGTIVCWVLVISLFTSLYKFLHQAYVIRAKFQRLRAQGIPLLPHSPVFGHLPILNHFRAVHPPDVNIYVFHTWLAANFKMYLPDHKHLPPIVYLDLWPFMSPLALIYDPCAAAQVTSANALKGPVTTQFLKPLTGNMDLISAEDHVWKPLRSMFNPAYSSRRILALLPELMADVALFVDQIQSLAGNQGAWGPVFSLEEKATNLTFDLICRSSMSTRLGAQRLSGGGPLKSALLNQIELMGLLVHPLRGHITRWMPWTWFIMARNNKTMERFFQSVVEHKLHSNINETRHTDIVDLAIHHSTKGNRDSGSTNLETDEKFRSMLFANLKAFLFAGHDTTASTLCYMLKYLQDNAKCLAKLRAEHDSVFGSDPDKIMDILTQRPNLVYELPYTLAVIKETLRLTPLVGSIRESTSQLTLTVPGSPINYPVSGFNLWMSTPGIHQNPDYWARAPEFLPERWLAREGDVLYPPKYGWIPFSQGPRNCIGMELALMQLKLVSVFLVRKFDIHEAWDAWDKLKGDKATVSHLVNGRRLYAIGDVSVHPKDGMPVHARLRRTQSSQ